MIVQINENKNKYLFLISIFRNSLANLKARKDNKQKITNITKSRNQLWELEKSG